LDQPFLVLERFPSAVLESRRKALNQILVPEGEFGLQPVVGQQFDSDFPKGLSEQMRTRFLVKLLGLWFLKVKPIQMSEAKLRDGAELSLQRWIGVNRYSG
jgi:hypothetical protein